MKANLTRRDGSVIETATGTEKEIQARFAEVGAYCATWLDDESPAPPDLAVEEGTGSASGYLPDWLDLGTDLFVDAEHWRTLYALGANCGWPEGWQRGLLSILRSPMDSERSWARPAADVLACVALLEWQGIHKRTGKPLESRSAEIKHSLKGQLIEWLESPAGERKFDSPFSPRQWAKCMRTKWNAYGTLRTRGNRIAYWVLKMWEAGGEMWPEECEDLVPITK